MPPPTWNEASEMPKNSMIRRPASALTAMTMNALNGADADRPPPLRRREALA